MTKTIVEERVSQRTVEQIVEVPKVEIIEEEVEVGSAAARRP